MNYLELIEHILNSKTDLPDFQINILLRQIKTAVNRKEKPNEIPPDLQRLLDIVCEVCNVDIETLQSHKRPNDLVVIRNIFIYVSRSYTKHSLKVIGACLLRDHSTAIHSVTNLSLWLKTKQLDQIHLDMLDKVIDRFLNEC